MDAFNKANLEIARLCNHKKSVGKNFDHQLTKINDTIKEYKKDIVKLKNQKNKDNNKSNKNINDKIAKLKIKIKKLKEKKLSKINLKDLSLGTSKDNYIDSRIVVAFSKKNNIPIEKFYSKNQLNKFKWAIDNPDIDENWQF